MACGRSRQGEQQPLNAVEQEDAVATDATHVGLCSRTSVRRHMSTYGQQQSPQPTALEAENEAAWSAYSALQPAPGWQQRSIDAATAAARAKFALDKANGYHN